MTDPQMPDMDAALHHAQLAQSSLEDFKHEINTGTFTGTDDARTVEVTINGRQWLTDLYIEDGLLRLGAETVGARLNEAVGNAQAAATAGVEAQQEQLLAKLADIAETLQAQARSLERALSGNPKSSPEERDVPDALLSLRSCRRFPDTFARRWRNSRARSLAEALPASPAESRP